MSLEDGGSAARETESVINTFRAVSNKDMVDISQERRRKKRRVTPSPSPSPSVSSASEGSSDSGFSGDSDYSGSLLGESSCSSRSSASSRRSRRGGGGVFSRMMTNARGGDHHSMPAPVREHTQHAPPPPSMSFSPFESTEDKEEKQLLMLQLQDLKRSGVVLSREFTMQDSLGVMRTEINFHRDSQNQESWVSMMETAIVVGSVVLQTANDRFGKVLELEGLSTEMKTKIIPLRPCLRQIYREQYSSFQLSPMKQLILGLASVVFCVHAQNKYGRGSAVESVMSRVTGIISSSNATSGPASAAEEAQPAAPAPQPQAPAPAPSQPQAPASQTGAAPATRVPLRPPSATHNTDTSVIIE